MGIEWHQKTGWPNKIIRNLKLTVTHFTNNSNNKFIKVGITNKPERRWVEHGRNDYTWSKMVVVYKSKTFEHCQQIERELIEHSWENDELVNEIGGGGGGKAESEYYYVYVLIHKHDHIEWRCKTGYPENVYSSLKKSISNFRNYNNYFKIGYTADPYKSWENQKRNDFTWEKMVVLYKTTSENHIEFSRHHNQL